jgi:hypothetical protein
MTATAPTLVRQASSAHISASSKAPMPSSQRKRRAGSRWVKKSTMMLAPRNCAQGRHKEMHSAMPNCVSSTSPWIGRVVSARLTTLVVVINATNTAASAPASAKACASPLNKRCTRALARSTCGT